MSKRCRCNKFIYICGSKLKLVLCVVVLLEIYSILFLSYQETLSVAKTPKNRIKSIHTGNSNERDHNHSFLTLYGPHRVSKSLANLPIWLQEYVKWHSSQRRQVQLLGHQYPIKYLVLHCFKKTKCGGIGDRMRPLPYYILLAKLTNRILLIKWLKPHDLSKFLVPPKGGLDWRSTPALDEIANQAGIHLKVRSTIENGCNKTPVSNFTEGFYRCVEIAKASEVQYYFISGSRCHGNINELNNLFQEYSNDNKNDTLLPLTGFDFVHSFGDIFRVFFEPVAQISRSINRTMEELGLIENQYTSVHIRARYPTDGLTQVVKQAVIVDKQGGLNLYGNKNAMNYLVDISMKAIQYASNISYDSSVIFLASDNNDISNLMVSHAKDMKILKDLQRLVSIDRVTEPLHFDIDFDDGTIPSDFYPLFEDFLIMGGSRCVFYGEGSFGRLGAGLINNKCRKSYLKNQKIIC